MGNKVSWFIAGGLVLVVIVAIVIVVAFPSKSDPTAATLAPGFMGKQAPTAALTLVLPAVPSEDGNAADQYRKALAICKSSSAEISAASEALAEDKAPSPEAIEAMKKIDDLCAVAAKKAKMEYCLDADRTQLAVAYEHPQTKELRSISGALYYLFFYYAKVQKNNELAQQVLFRQFTLGYHMQNERALPVVVAAGMDIQDAACAELIGLYKLWGEGHLKQGEDVQQYRATLGKPISFFRDKLEVAWSVKPEPGDIFNIIENDQDPCWRTQAILDLGVLKFTAQKRGDRKYLQKLTDRLLQSGNPMEKAAAQAARDLTLEQFNLLGRPPE